MSKDKTGTLTTGTPLHPRNQALWRGAGGKCTCSDGCGRTGFCPSLCKSYPVRSRSSRAHHRRCETGHIVYWAGRQSPGQWKTGYCRITALGIRSNRRLRPGTSSLQFISCSGCCGCPPGGDSIFLRSIHSMLYVVTDLFMYFVGKKKLLKMMTGDTPAAKRKR